MLSLLMLLDVSVLSQSFVCTQQNCVYCAAAIGTLPAFAVHVLVDDNQLVLPDQVITSTASQYRAEQLQFVRHREPLSL
jgi:hypothetical protein